jgi:hypothetical protein
MASENHFKVDGNTVTCKFKKSASTYCNKSYKLQKSKDGSSWQIPNFTNHLNGEHQIKNIPKKVSPASPRNLNQETVTDNSTSENGNLGSRKRKSTSTVILQYFVLLIKS